MDDTQRIKVEFPVGDFKITVKEPTGEQMFVLAMSRQPKTEADTVRLVTRLTTIMQKLTGDQWFDVIEANMVDELMTVGDLLTLVEEMLSFPWAEHHKPQPVPETVPDELVAEFAPKDRPAPRVVGG